MNDTRRVLITGGGGFVGSHLSEGFAAAGWHVTAVDREFDDPTRARLAAVDMTVSDLCGAECLHLPAADVIVHAAAITTEARHLRVSRAAHVAANLQPLERMLELARQRPPGAFVFVSSSGVFGPEDGLECLADVDLPTARTPYAVAKQLGEAMTSAALDGCCATHVVRLGYVYGPHEAARRSRTRVSAVAHWLTEARQGRPLEVRSDDPRRDWTFAPDLAPALLRIVQAPARRRPVHLASPHIIRDSAMARMIAAHFSAPTCSIDPREPAKPPMRASDLCALNTYPWTAPAPAVARLVAGETSA